MARPVTLFTGQCADLPIAELAAQCGEWGFDGLELASWGDHFDVARALSEDGYCAARRELLESRGLGCWAISNHPGTGLLSSPGPLGGAGPSTRRPTAFGRRPASSLRCPAIGVPPGAGARRDGIAASIGGRYIGGAPGGSGVPEAA